MRIILLVQYVAFISLIFSLFFLSSCTDDRPTWQHIYRDDENLIGVRIQQTPDSAEPGYERKHPAMVLYVFKREPPNAVLQIGFTPEGVINEAFWWEDKFPEWMNSQLVPIPGQLRVPGLTSQSKGTK
jgi:hypothetical protein